VRSKLSLLGTNEDLALDEGRLSRYKERAMKKTERMKEVGDNRTSHNITNKASHHPERPGCRLEVNNGRLMARDSRTIDITTCTPATPHGLFLCALIGQQP